MRIARAAVASPVLAMALAALPGGASPQFAGAAPEVAAVTVRDPVTLRDGGDRWTLSNGIVTITVLKRDGQLPSLRYAGRQLLGKGRAWEQSPAGAVTARVTIDPATNRGERAEVAVRGSDRAGGYDMETRYALESGTSGFYTYAQFAHPADYPAASIGESRFMLEELDPTFDWLSVDADRNLLMSQAPEAVRVHAPEQSIYASGLYANSVEHKYSYDARPYALTAWGWASTRDRIGVYLMNPSNEYVGGGPEKLDLVDHLSAPGSKTYRANVLDYWVSGHYAGGDTIAVPHGTAWSRVVGPVFAYLDRLATAREPTPADLERLRATSGGGEPAVPGAWRENSLALWCGAVATSEAMRAAWPFAWVNGVDYPHRAERGSVSGRLVLSDPQAASTALPHLHVGLTHADYRVQSTPFQLRAGNGDVVTWPHDGTYYQFWTDGSADGRFTIRNVRPGTYTLHAFADGVLGEYATANVTVRAGESRELGALPWRPVRYGRQLWEIGYPNRTGDEFLEGDGADYWLWGWGLRYAGLFPHDVTYTVGASDYRKDWFFQEVPHALSTAWLNPAAKDPYAQRFGWVAIPSSAGDPWPTWGQGRATTWTVRFDTTAALQGTAVLRIALAGADGTGGLAIAVNGRDVGTLHPVATNALRYNTDRGAWYQYLQRFDARLLHAGENTVTFTVPAGDVTTGVVWDYLRLELHDASGMYSAVPDGPRPDAPER